MMDRKPLRLNSHSARPAYLKLLMIALLIGGSVMAYATVSYFYNISVPGNVIVTITQPEPTPEQELRINGVDPAVITLTFHITREAGSTTPVTSETQSVVLSSVAPLPEADINAYLHNNLPVGFILNTHVDVIPKAGPGWVWTTAALPIGPNGESSYTLTFSVTAEGTIQASGTTPVTITINTTP